MAESPIVGLLLWVVNLRGHRALVEGPVPKQRTGCRLIPNFTERNT